MDFLFYVRNASKIVTARNPKHAFGIWDLDSGSVKDPLSIPVETATGDFILPTGISTGTIWYRD